jgi:hypothetical protein
LLSATADKGVQARKHWGGAEVEDPPRRESIEKVIAKQCAAILTSYFDISCSMFDILYVIPAKVGFY